MRLGYNNVLDRPKREREDPPERVVAPIRFEGDWQERLGHYHAMARQHERGLKYYKGIDDKVMVAHLEEQRQQNHRDLIAASEQYHQIKSVREQYRRFKDANRDAERGDRGDSDNEEENAARQARWADQDAAQLQLHGWRGRDDDSDDDQDEDPFAPGFRGAGLGGGFNFGGGGFDGGGFGPQVVAAPPQRARAAGNDGRAPMIEEVD